MSKALQVGMAVEAALYEEGSVSSPGYSLLFSVVRTGSLKPVMPDWNGQGVAWGVCVRGLWNLLSTQVWSRPNLENFSAFGKG